MKIAIICPIGDLNRFGYWRIAQTCLESWRAIGDLFLIHSSRSAMPFGIRANYICDDNTLMSVGLDDSGKWGEWFDHRLIAANVNRGIEIARSAGYDVAITICVNWYIEVAAGAAIVDKCRRMRHNQNGFDFLYRRIQIGSKLFDADLMSVVVFDLSAPKQAMVKVLVDSAEISNTEIVAIRGRYGFKNNEAYIDCEHELTTAELQEKLADVRNYEDILPKRHGADWEFWQRYYQDRASKMILSSDAPGPIGQQIAERHPDGAFGDWLLEKMKTTEWAI